MVTPVRLALFALALLTFPLVAATPVGRIRYVPAGQSTESPIAAASGDRALVIWNRGQGAVRIDAASLPLDVPAIALPKPTFTAGADLIATGTGWTIGWTIFELGDLASSSLQLVDVDREGSVSDVRVYALSDVVSQNGGMHLAARAGVTAVAYQSEQRAAVAFIDERGDVKEEIFTGSVVELVATASSFALVLRDRVLLLDATGLIVGLIPLPEGFTASDVELDGGDLLLAGSSGDAVAVVRVREGKASAVASMPGASPLVRLSRIGRELFVVWKRPTTTYTSATWDLMAARLSLDAPAAEAVLVRPAIDATGRFTCCADPPEVVALDGEFTLLWSEGFRSAGMGWRNVFAARASAGTAIGEPRLLTFRAAGQTLVGTAQRDGVVFVVWGEQPVDFTEPFLTYAARFTMDGRRIDGEDLVLGAIQPRAVRAIPDGFAVLTSSAIVTVDANGAIRSSPVPAPLSDLSCTPAICLAVWRETAGGDGPAAIRVSRWRDGVFLDSPGMALHFSDTAYNELVAANDGERFLVAFARPVAPGGSVLSVSRVAWPDGESRIETSNAAASTSSIVNLHLVFEGDGYLATWIANGYRASRLDVAGNVTDGEETGWEGWPLPVGAPIRRLLFDGERTLLVTSDSPRYAIYELHGRVPVAIEEGEARMASMDCAAPRVCAVTLLQNVRGWPWYVSERLLLRGTASKRRAASPR